RERGLAGTSVLTATVDMVNSSIPASAKRANLRREEVLKFGGRLAPERSAVPTGTECAGHEPFAHAAQAQIAAILITRARPPLALVVAPPYTELHGSV